MGGALVTLWTTFAAYFLWIFAGAPWIDGISARPVLRAALAGVTAAVVGVVANLSVWFSLHVLFERAGTVRAGAVELALPDWASLDWRSALIVLGRRCSCCAGTAACR